MKIKIRVHAIQAVVEAEKRRVLKSIEQVKHCPTHYFEKYFRCENRWWIWKLNYPLTKWLRNNITETAVFIFFFQHDCQKTRFFFFFFTNYDNGTKTGLIATRSKTHALNIFTQTKCYGYDIGLIIRQKRSKTL